MKRWPLKAGDHEISVLFEFNLMTSKHNDTKRAFIINILLTIEKAIS